MRSPALALGARLLGLIALVATTGCPAYHVQQSSLVPALSLPPPPSSRGVADFYVADSTVTFLMPPELAPNENAGLFIPRTQLEGAFAGRPSEWVSLRLLWLDALPQGALAAAPTRLPSPDMHAWGIGGGIVVGTPERHGPLSYHVAVDVLPVSVPSRVRVACVQNCEGAPPPRETLQRDTVPLMSLMTTLGWAVSPTVRLTASAAVKNHPTNIESFRSLTPRGEVYSGPLNVIVGLGGEFRLGSWCSLVPQLQIPVTAEPVRYGMIFGLGVRATLERPAAPR
ncbi:MAG TPA: hypothetical protein VGQ83_09520 [Polyangia bacterium]|jgi:hypothetical protein